MIKISFEQFLQEKHLEDDPHLLDDMITDKFEQWVTDLPVDTFIEFAQQYADKQRKEGYELGISHNKSKK